MIDIDNFHIDRSNWKITKFGEVAIQQKKSVDREQTNLNRYVKGEHMYSEDIHLREWGELEDEYLGPAFIRYFEEGDILYGSRRTYLKKVVIAPFEGITSNTTFVIKAKESKIDKRLLPYIMLSEGFTEHSIRNSKGSVNPYINWKDIANYEFLLPPKDQQKQLAELLWAMDEVIEKEKEVLEKLEISKLSIFNELHKLRFNSHKLLSSICKKISSGGTPNRQKEHEYYGGKIPWVKTKELNDWLIKDTEEHITEIGLKKSSTKLYPPNTIMLAMYGATVGKIAMIDKEMACNQACCAIIVNSKEVDEWFLFYYLMALKNRLIALSVGSAQPNISASIIKTLKIPNIPKGIQSEYSNKLIQIDCTKNQTISKIASSKALQKSLINQIF